MSAPESNLRILAGSTADAAATAQAPYATLERAKQDWESTADTLPQVICLLDAECRAIRVNRSVESWQLARVGDTLGRHMHDVLHPHVCTAQCTLRELLQLGWTAVQAGSSSEFELHDPHLQRLVTVALRPVSADSRILRPGKEPRAVMIVTDITALQAVRRALEIVNENLEARIQERTRALETVNCDLQHEMLRREQAEEALRQSRNELELLSQQLIRAQERERQRISQELHDSIGQSMSAIKYSLERTVELQRQGKQAESQRLLRQTIEGVRGTAVEIRTIAMGLRPAVLDDLGVASALEWLSRGFAETYAEIRLHTHICMANEDIPDRLATTLFRSAQELLNNVAKHANAHRVSIALLQDADTIVLRVCDDGRGLPDVSQSGSYGTGHGIRNLRERAQMTGGTFTLTANPGGGTRAQMQWPLSATASVG